MASAFWHHISAWRPKICRGIWRPAHRNAERSEGRQIPRQIFGRHAEMRCQNALAIGNYEMAGASRVLVGVQHPLCQSLNSRSQSLILEMFNELAKLARKLIHYRARERGIHIDQFMNSLQWDKQKLTALQGACSHWIDLVREGREHERLG